MSARRKGDNETSSSENISFLHNLWLPLIISAMWGVFRTAGTATQRSRRGLGSDETQLGRYTLVFEFAGQRTELVSLFVEDLPILKQIEAEFVISRSRDGLAIPDENVTLIVRNNSDQTLRFPQPDGVNSMVSVSLSKSERSYRNDFFYPAESLPGGGKTSAISFDTFTWDVASRAPAVAVRPGETYCQEMPLRAALGEAEKGSSVHPGSYDVTFFTTLQILIGEKDGKWSEFSGSHPRLRYGGLCYHAVITKALSALGFAVTVL